MPVNPIVRILDRSNMAETRPALERAGYHCESCPRSDDLRVVELRGGQLVVLCSTCQLRTGLARRLRDKAREPRYAQAAMQPNAFPTDTRLQCKCGKVIEGAVREGPSWEQNAELAQRYGWLPVIVGDAVGASVGSHYYACSSSCQTDWLSSLR